MKPMVGNYRREHLFTLRQCLMAYREYQRSVQCRSKVEISYFGKVETLEGSPLSLCVHCRERCSPSRVRIRRAIGARP